MTDTLSTTATFECWSTCQRAAAGMLVLLDLGSAVKALQTVPADLLPDPVTGWVRELVQRSVNRGLAPEPATLAWVARAEGLTPPPVWVHDTIVSGLWELHSDAAQFATAAQLAEVLADHLARFRAAGALQVALNAVLNGDRASVDAALTDALAAVEGVAR